MTNKYLEKASALIRSPENIGSRLAQLGMAAANRLQRTKGVLLNHQGRVVSAPSSLPRGERALHDHDKLVRTANKLHAQPNSGHPAVDETFKKKVGDKPNIFYR